MPNSLEIVAEESIAQGRYKFTVVAETAGSRGDFVTFTHDPTAEEVTAAHAVGSWQAPDQSIIGEGAAPADAGVRVVARCGAQHSSAWCVLGISK